MTSTVTKGADLRETRVRLIESASELFSTQGYGGTGIKMVLAKAEAPYGSLYHFFPGGKQELGAAALEYSGNQYREQIEAFHPVDSDPVEAVRTSFSLVAQRLESTDFSNSCPIATLALEIASTHESMRLAAAAAFESWIEVLERHFTQAGIDPERAHEVAIEGFCLMEGSAMLSRTTRSIEPLRIAGEAAANIVETALAEARAKK